MNEYRSGAGSEVTVPLPLQVIELIKQYKSTFDSFEIWSESKDQVDPILIGNPKTGRESLQYLICRWGEALKPFSEIREQVIEQWKKTPDAIDYLSGNWVNNWIH